MIDLRQLVVGTYWIAEGYSLVYDPNIGTHVESKDNISVQFRVTPRTEVHYSLRYPDKLNVRGHCIVCTETSAIVSHFKWTYIKANTLRPSTKQQFCSIKNIVKNK